MSVEQLPERVETRPVVERAVKQPAPSATDRLVSLDAYRGFVMLLMASAGLGLAAIPKDDAWLQLVKENEYLRSPFWNWLWGQFDHRVWEGCSLWDLIQPSFMFIVGVAMPFSFARRLQQGQSWNLQFRHVLVRALGLILVGVFLDSFSDQHLVVSMIRVLQQIALGYVIAFLVLNCRPRYQLLTAAGVLVLHTAAFVIFAMINKSEAWVIKDNFGVWLDTQIHAPFAALAGDDAKSLWNFILPVPKGNYADINALSSTATIIFGVMCGELLRSGLSSGRKLLILLGAGFLGLLLGIALDPRMLPLPEQRLVEVEAYAPVLLPAIKRIWTASFTLFAAGWTFLLMAVFYLIVDMARYRRWAFPLVVVGMNSIAMYVISGTIRTSVIQRTITTFGGDVLPHLHPFGPAVLSALVLLGMWGCCYWLYRHKVFIKL